MFTKENSYNHAHVLDLRIMSAKIRKLTLESITNANSGHPGGSLSVTDILTALYFGKVNGKRVVTYDPAVPNHPCRDRVVLSKGHAAPALYSTLAHAGFIDKDEVRYHLRQLDSRLQGHPSMKHTPGVDFSTGSLGQGLSAAVGMALAGKERRMGYKVFAILGDGEMQEGQVWEALLSIPNKGLNNLCVIIDANGIQIDGTTKEINDLAVLEDKLRAFNFDVKRIEGHMYERILDALNDGGAEELPRRPKAIIAYTIKGKGVTFIEDNEDYHGTALSPEELASALNGFNTTIRTLRKKRQNMRFNDIEDTLGSAPIGEKQLLPNSPCALKAAEKVSFLKPKATREAYSDALLYHKDDPYIYTLNADLAKSLKTDKVAIKTDGKRSVNLGIQEQNMIGAAAGLAAEGFKAFANSFAIFHMRATEQIINSVAYPNRNVKLAASHAGLATGPDGASHQCISDIGIITSIPNMLVVEPADAYQTRSLMEKILQDDRPTYIRLGRNAVPLIFNSNDDFELEKGYQLTEGDDVTLVAAGLTYLALEAEHALRRIGIRARVVNMPTIKPIDRGLIVKAARETMGFVTLEDHNIKNGLGGQVSEVLDLEPAYLIRIGSEDEFGTSARDWREIYARYGITVENVVQKALQVIEAFEKRHGLAGSEALKTLPAAHGSNSRRENPPRPALRECVKS
jgi:transketolase